MKKKILILFVRRAYLEIEYILPVLKILEKKYTICTYFEKRAAYTSLQRQKEVYNEWIKINSNYYILDITDNLIFKIILKLLIFFELSNSSIFKKVIFGVHSLENVCKKLNVLKSNVKFILSDLNTRSETLNQLLLEKKKKIKVCFFPTSPQTVKSKSDIINTKGRPLLKHVDILLINSKYDFLYWSNFLEKKKIKIIGPSIFINLKNKRNFKNNNPKILISYNCLEFKYQAREKKNIKELLKKILKLKFKIVIKLHPEKQENYIFDLVKEINSRLISFSNKNLKYLMQENILIHICSIKTAAASYSNYFKIPTFGFPQYHHNYDPNSFQIKHNLIKKINNFEDFKKEIYLISKGDKSIEYKQHDSFRKIYKIPHNIDKFILDLFND